MIQNRKSASLLGQASRPVVELLEIRQLLSQVIAVSATQLVFNAVQNSSASQIETETITNTGTAPLTLGVGSTTLANDPAWPTADSSRFTLINGGSVPATLAPGASFGVQLDYNANAVTTNSAYLDIASDDPVNPMLQIQLRGIGTKGLGGNNQPSLATILQAYNIPTLVGDGPNDANALQDNTYPYPPDSSSQEVVLQRLAKAGAGPVTINVLASFTASGTHPYTLGTYTPGDPTGLSELFTTPSSEYQSVYVQPQGATTFDPGSKSFGFYFISNVQVKGRVGYSEDALNTWDSTTGRHFRFFPMETPTGGVVPNQYVMTSTEWNAPIGYDFTNIVAIVSNVKLAPSAPTAPVLGVQDVNALPGNNTMVFNRIQNQNTAVGDTVHDTGTLRVNDTGGSPLILNSYTLSAGWTLVNPPTFPVTIAAGASLDLSIKFVQSSRPSVPYNETNGPMYGSGGGVLKGAITLTSDDPNNPTATMPLAGWWQLHSENENEPSLQSIVNLLENWGTNINPKPIPDLTESAPGPTSTPTYYGEEVVSAYWQQADPSLGVKVQQVDSYHTQGTSVQTYWYPKGGGSNKLFSTVADTGQSLLPSAFNTSTPAAGTFSTSSSFGFRIDNEYTDDAKNTGYASGGGHHIRFYPLRDSTGALVSNTYIMALDYSNVPQNFDFQDNIYVVSNIRPAAVTAAPTDAYASNLTTGNLLQWSSIIDSSLQGYNVYRASSAGGTYTLLTPTPISAISYDDVNAPTSGSSYYKVTAVSSSKSESLGVTASITNSGGGGVITNPGSPVASPETVNTMAGNAVTINEFPDASDEGGTLIVSSVTVTLAPGHGAASVNTSDGSITYTPAAGFTGVDTFQYTVGDNTGATSAPATITVNVSAVPIGNPVAADLSESTTQNVPLTINVIAAATDSGATLSPATVTVTVAPAHGTTSVDPVTGNILYTPATGYFGTDAFLYTIGDSLMSVSPSATVSLTITSAPTGAPVAANITVPPTTGSTSTTIDVVGAATDHSSTLDPTSVTITTQPAHGIASVNAATGVITYTPIDGFVGADSLQYTIADAAHFVSPAGTISLNTGLTINNTTARSLAFTDVNGSKVRLTLSGGGSGLLFFNGSGLARTIPGPHGTGSLSLTGTGLSIASMQITGSTITGALVVTRTGLAPVTLGNVTVAGALGRIVAPSSSLTGTLSISGSLGLLQIFSATGANITIGSTGATRAGLTIVAGHVTNTNLTSTTPIRTLKVTDWVESGATDAISAPSIYVLSTTGDFDAALTLTGAAPYALTVARIGGQISSDAWNINGTTSSLVAGSIATGWTGNLAGAINAFVVRTSGFGGTLTTGAINALTIIGNDTGTINAASIRSARVVGQLYGASVNVNNAVAPRAYSLGRLSVSGATVNSQITSNGNIGTITTAGMSDSSIDAGVASNVTLPATSADFISAASIGTVVITGRGSTFADSNIAAATLGPLSLGEIITASGDTPFGIAADTIRSMTMVLDTNLGGGLLRLHGLVLLSGTSIATYVATNSLTLNSFVIRPGL